MNKRGVRQVPVEPALGPGETTEESVGASVRSPVEFRSVQMRFHQRGQAAWEHYQATGLSSSPDEMTARLQARLDAKRRQLGG